MSIKNKKDYQNSKIYQITSHYGDKIYIGSTTKKYLSQRMDRHRSSYKLWKQGKVRKTIIFNMFDMYGIENCEILLLETYPCHSNDELVSREGYFIRTMDCVNKNVVGRTRKEYREDNKEKIQKYYEDNKEQILQQMKEYSKVKITCGCGSIICQGSASKHNKSIKHQNFLKTQITNTM